MNALSNDLRWRIFSYSLSHSVRETAKVFQVSPNTVHLLTKLFIETGDLAPRVAEAVHPHRVSPEGEMFLQILLREEVDLTLEELCERYRNAYGVRVGISTMHETLKSLGFTYKKKTFYDPNKNGDENEAKKDFYINRLEGIKPEDRVYLDEMGCCLNMSLEYGRSPRGERVYDEKPTSPSATVSTAAVLTEHGVEAAGMYFGALTAERFIMYLEMYALSLLVGGKTLIMDCHPVHCAKIVKSFLDERQINFLNLPPYSPELNPIEEAFAKIKHYVRKHKPRVVEDLFDTIKTAINSVTEDDAIGYINHAEEFI